MKKIREALPVVALLLLLNGCAAQEQTSPPESQIPTMEITLPMETEPLEKTEHVTEETNPVRESVQETESASDTMPPVPETTESQRTPEPEKSVRPEQPAVASPKKEPVETKPQATEPPVTEPPHTESPMTEPPQTDPQEKPIETQPPATKAEESVIAPTDPPETLPAETEPVETSPQATEPPATELVREKVDAGALASYGRQYAASTYGYNGSPNCTPSTNAGYFPGVRVRIATMEDGYAAAREAVDYQYACDAAMGRPISVEIDGVTVRRNINIYFEPTEDSQVFIVWCYYGGEA